MRADGHWHAAATAVAESLGHHHRVGEIEFLTAVFGRILEAKQAQVAQLLEHFVRGKLLGGFPRGDMRVDLLAHEAADGVGKLAMFGSELHGCSFLEAGDAEGV